MISLNYSLNLWYRFHTVSYLDIFRWRTLFFKFNSKLPYFGQDTYVSNNTTLVYYPYHWGHILKDEEKYYKNRKTKEKFLRKLFLRKYTMYVGSILTYIYLYLYERMSIIFFFYVITFLIYRTVSYFQEMLNYYGQHINL